MSKRLAETTVDFSVIHSHTHLPYLRNRNKVKNLTKLIYWVLLFFGIYLPLTRKVVFDNLTKESIMLTNKELILYQIFHWDW